MSANFKNRFWKLCKWFGGLFVLLFVFRLIYGYVEKNAKTSNDYNSDFFSSLENVRRNYASEKVAKMEIQSQSNMASNQKFEKTASITTKTSKFESDDRLIKAKTKAYNAVIQYEQSFGQKGNRKVHLLIGVNPASFDSFYVDIQKIGLVKSREIVKVDKTNEYRQLNAQKTSLEKTLQSLNELKSKGGEISDYISLNDKILEIEGRLQELGVELGNFDEENEFCTVRFSLYEGETEVKISFIHRVKVALEWSVRYFALIVFTLLGLSLTVFILLLITDRINLIGKVTNKLNS